MLKLKFEEVLVFYEVPQVFVASDMFDAKYICMLYSDVAIDNCCKYLAVKISSRRLEAFKGAAIDLLSIYNLPEEDAYFDIEVISSTEINANIIQRNEVLPNMLPDEGFFCNYDLTSEVLVSQSMQKGKMMTSVAFCDDQNSHDIDVGVLSKALTSYQNMVRNCHVKLFGKQYGNEADMRACALHAASFDVLFTLNEPFDIFGVSSRTSKTLSVIDEIMSSAETEVLNEKVEMVKGHTLNYMRNFLKLLKDNNLTFRHKWVKSSIERKVSSNIVSLPKISKVHEYLSSRTELENVEVEITGYFGACSILNKGNWTFININDNNKRVCGSGMVMNGITIGADKHYKIRCKETQTLDPVSNRPSYKYTLIDCTPL